MDVLQTLTPKLAYRHDVPAHVAAHFPSSVRSWARARTFRSTIAYTNMKGERWAYPLWQQMMHLVNHGTQHRSEAAVMLTLFGHSPGELDLLHYVDAHTPRA